MVRDAEPDRGVYAPSRECRRDWLPVEEPRQRRSRKCADEPVRTGDGSEPEPAVADECWCGASVPVSERVASLSGGDADA